MNDLLLNKMSEEMSGKIEENGRSYDVKVDVSSSLCSVSLCTECKTSADKDLIEQLNDVNSLFRYKTKNNKLCISTTMWIDLNPTKTGLKSILAMLISCLDAAVIFMENL